jgi:GT2 family glycosyltransferase
MATDFSIIIPTRDRASQLIQCLEAVARQQYPSTGYEVIVVDDGSAEPVGPALDAFRSRVNLTVVRQPGQGPAAARQAGAAVARGRWLAFTDDDCRPAPDWLEKLSARLSAAPDRMVGGRTVNGLPDNLYAAASQTLIAYLYHYFNPDPEQARFLVSCNAAASAQLFRAVGGFDSSYPRAAAEDRDLCDRWLRAGHALVYAPEAIVYHYHPLRGRSYLSQHFRYGRGAFAFWRAKGRRSGERVRVEPPHFYLNLLRFAFRQPGLLRPWTVAALLAVSQIANAAGFFYQ